MHTHNTHTHNTHTQNVLHTQYTQYTRNTQYTQMHANLVVIKCLAIIAFILYKFRLIDSIHDLSNNYISLLITWSSTPLLK